MIRRKNYREEGNSPDSQLTKGRVTSRQGSKQSFLKIIKKDTILPLRKTPGSKRSPKSLSKNYKGIPFSEWEIED